MTTLSGVPRLGFRTLRPRRRPALVWLPALAVAAAMAIPVVYLIVRAAEADSDAWSDLGHSSTLTLLKNTVVLAFAVTGAAATLALPTAWLTIRTDLPLRRMWSVISVLPLVIPSFVGALAFIAALGPRGTFQRLLEPLGVDSLPTVYGFPGTWLALTLFTFPYLLLPLRAGLRGIDPALEEASRALGASSWHTFWRVIAPQLRVPMAAGALLVALYVVSDFGAVSLLRYDTFTRAIFVQYQSSFDRAAAAVLGLELVALVVLLLTLETSTRSRGRYYQSGSSAKRRPRVIRLGRWRWPAIAFLMMVTLLALAIPIGVLLDWLIRGLRAGESFSTTGGAAWNSLSVSGIAGLVAIVAAIPVAIVSVRHPSPLAMLVDRMSYFGFALPGIVVALSLVFFSLNVVPWLYQSWSVLIFAYLVLFFPQALGAIRTSLVRIKPSVEEAARSLGRSSPWIMLTVTVPLLVPGMASGFALVFLTAMKELPATLLLAPIEFDTLATRIWSASNEAFFARAAAPALILIALAAIPMVVMISREHDFRE